MKNRCQWLIAFFKKTLVFSLGIFFVFTPSLLQAQDKCKELFTPEAFAKSMTENLKLLRDQKDLFDLYRSSYFGDPKADIKRDYQDMMDVLEEHPELSKKVFREQEITFERKSYEVTESLKSLIEKFKAPYRTLSGKLFNVSNNLHFWKKILGFKREEEFIKYFETFVSKKDIAFIDNKSISYKDRAVFLYKILNHIREDQIRKGKDIQRISQILLDLTHTVGLGDPYISRLIKSKNASERLEALHKLLSARDSMAIELGFEEHFSEMQKTLGLNPSSFSKKENVYELLRQAEEELYQSPYQKINSQSFRVRALSLQESPFRSCLGGSDCSSNTYFLKALDPNFIYFTLTDQEHRSSGHITVVLGEARNKKGESLKIGFVDKIQNVPREKITAMLSAVRKSLEEEGYSLALPKDVGNENGLSNDMTTREYIEREVNPKLKEELLSFKPHESSYNFSNGYSRAYARLDLYKYESDLLDLEIKPGKRRSVQTVSKLLNKESLFDQVLLLRDSKKEEDQIRFISYVSLLLDLKILSFEYLKFYLEGKIKNRSLSLSLRKPAFFNLIELHESLEKNLRYEEIEGFLSEFSKEEQKILIGEMSNWIRGNNVKRRDFIIGLLFAEERPEEDRISILNSELLKPLININMKDPSSSNALMWAIRNNQLAFAESLIKKGVDIHSMNPAGESAFIHAIKYNYPAIAKLLIERGIDIHAVDLAGINALMYAVSYNQKELAELLIERGIDIHAVDRDGKNALMYAVSYNQQILFKLFTQKETDAFPFKILDPYLAKLLIERGIDIHAMDSRGYNALIYAIKYNQIALAELLLEKGIDLNAVNPVGMNALMYVINFGQPVFAKFLIEKGIDIHAVDKDGKNALLHAIENNHTDLVKLLIERGIDIHAVDWRGDNALIYAIKYDQIALVELLLEKGINVLNSKGKNPLIKAIADHRSEIAKLLIEKDLDGLYSDNQNALLHAIKYNQADTAKLLIERGIDIHKLDSRGQNALIYTIKRNQAEIAKLLIERGIDIHVVDFFGKNTLMLALENNRPAIAELLIERGIDIHAVDSEGQNALIYAIKNNQKAIIELLIERGIDIRDLGDSLIMSVTRGYRAFTKFLIESGADINAMDSDSRNALMYAVSYGHTDLVDLLIEKGIDLNAVNKEGRNVLMLDLMKKHPIFGSLLIEKGIDIHAVDSFGKNALMYAIENNQTELVQLLKSKALQN